MLQVLHVAELNKTAYKRADRFRDLIEFFLSVNGIPLVCFLRLLIDYSKKSRQQLTDGDTSKTNILYQPYVIVVDSDVFWFNNTQSVKTDDSTFVQINIFVGN